MLRIASTRPARMSVPILGNRLVRVSFDCNSHRDGEFEGRARLLVFEPLRADGKPAWTLELDHDDFVAGARLSVDEALCTLKLGRISYRYKRRQGWFGNWCWDAFYMPRPAALHLLRGVLAGGQWRVSCGPDRVVGWVERAGRCYLSTRQLPNSQRSTITSPPVQVTV